MAQPARSVISVARRWAALALLAGASPVWAQANLGDSTFSGPSTYIPGNPVPSTYTLVVNNRGDAANTPTTTTSFPPGVTVSWACSAMGAGSSCANASGSGNLNRSADVVGARAGSTDGELRYTITAGFASSMTASPLVVPAVVTPSGGNALDLSVSSTRSLRSDLSVVKTASATTYSAPGSVSYTVVVANAGPSDVIAATLADTAPAGVSFGTRSCTASGGATCPAAGSGNLSLDLDIPAGGSLSFTVPASIAAGTQADPLVNTASVTAPAGTTDPTSGNNSDSANLDLVKADLAVVFVPASPVGTPTASYTPGTTGNTLDIRVTNNGDFASTGSQLSVSLPPQVSAATLSCVAPASCTADSGTGSLSVALGGIAVNGTITARLTLTYPSDASASSIDIAASIAGNQPDLSAGNNSSTWRADLRRQVRIGLSKTSSSAVLNPGGALTYDITVTNLGPSDVGNIAGDTGILLSDTLSAQLGRNLASGACSNNGQTTPCWRYCPDDDGSVAALTPDACTVELVEGDGSFANQGFLLRAGSSSTLRVFATVGANASGSLLNDALARVQSGLGVSDQGAGNCPLSGSNTICARSTVSVQASTDIEVTVSDGATSAVPGVDHAYTVVVRNNGTLTANNVNLQTALPILASDGDAGFASGSARWQCRAFDGACCTSNSSVCGTTGLTPPISAAVINQGVDLPPQSRVEFILSGRLDPSALGTLTVNAEATPPAGLIDSIPGNNTASDANTLLVPTASLSLSKVLDSVVPDDDTTGGAPFRLDYRIQVSNAGPSAARNAVLTDDLASPLLVASSGRWQCAVVQAAGLTACTSSDEVIGPVSEMLRLDPGGVVEVGLKVLTTDTASGEVVNTATVSSLAGSASATAVSGLTGVSALSISLTDGRSEAVPGTPTSYSIRVRNDGPDDAFGAGVSALFPSSLESVSWSCSAITPIPGDLSFANVGGLQNQKAGALLMSEGGEQAYLVLPEANAIQVLARNAVPGQGFGELSVLETETNGTNDPSDSGATVAGLLNPVDLSLSPDGTLLFVLARPASGPGVPSLVSFNRVSNPADPAFGRLSYAGTVSTGVPVQAQRIVSSATHVYVSGSSPAAVSVFRRDPASGLPIHDSVHTDAVPTGASALALDRARARLFVAGSGGQIVQYALNTEAASGPLGRLGAQGAAFSTGLAGIVDLALVPANRSLYAASATSARLDLLTYADAGLTAVASYTRSATDAPGSAADPLAGDGRLALAPDGEHLYRVSTSAGSLLGFRRDTLSGTLSEGRVLYDAVSTPGLASARAVAVSGDGRHVLVANDSGSGRPLHAYARRAPDPLFAFLEQERDGIAGTAGLLSPADLAVSPDGRHLYAVSLQDGALSVFERFSRRGVDGATQGDHLEFRARYVNGQDGVVAGLDRASRVLVSPDGRSVYVTSEDRNTLTVFERNVSEEPASGFGRLTYVTRFADGVGGVDGLLGAQGMAMDPDGRHLYVSGSFEAAIAIFARDPTTRALSYQGQVRNGSAGVSGLSGIRDLLVSRDGRQLLGVGSISNAVVVFNRDRSLVPGEGGRLSFVQALNLQSGARLMSLSMPQGALPTDGEHVYVVGQTTSSLFVLRRNTDVTSPGFGRLAPAFQYSRNQPGLSRMNGPRDVQVSADGRRVYVAAQFGHSVLVFDRDLNRSGAGYGGLSLLETRTDGLEGVDGLNDVYAVGLSPDSRNVYAAGFGDRAIASFAVGAGSSCSAGGSGDIDDRVNLGVGGTLEYSVQAMIRPGATGTLETLAEVERPARFEDPDLLDNLAQDSTALTPRGDLAVSKTNNRVSVVGGETVRYEVVVRNAGPSHLRHTPSSVVEINDRLSALPGFEPGSVSWTCTAAGSGALDFTAAYANNAAGEPGLGGVTGLALVPDSDGAGPLPAYLAAVSVLDSRLLLFRRDAVDGRLQLATGVAQGQNLGGSPVSQLLGARSVAVSADSRFLYVASRESDSLNVFELSHSGSTPVLALRQTVQGVVGLDQALHVVLSADGAHLYVAGANDAAVAVFSRDAATGQLSHVESEREGVDDASDAGGVVSGLIDVEFLVLSPDGEHLYALSGASGSVALFDRDSASGRLSFRAVRGAAQFGVSTDGASGAAFDPEGRQLYLAATGANRLLVLNREINPASGNFGQLSLGSSLQQGVAEVQGLQGPRRVALSSDGVHVYVTAQAGGSVAWFVRDDVTGTLRFLGLRASGSGGVQGLDGATGLVVDSVRNHVYVAGSLAPGAEGAIAGGLAAFRREADSECPASGTGDLVDVPISVASGGSVTFQIEARVSSGVAVGSSLTNTVTLTAPQDTTPENNSASDTDVVALVADLAIRKDDGLAEFDGLAGAVAVSGDASRLFVAGPTDNAIGVFRRIEAPGQPQTGELRFARVLRSGVGAVTGLGGVAGVLASPDGAHVYAVSPIENTVVVFRRRPAPVELEFVEVEQNGVFGVSGLAGASALALSADGRHLYVAGSFANAIAVFARSADSSAADYGRLSYQGLVQNGVGGVDGIAGINALAVSPDGRHVYALGAASSTLAVFARNPNAGSAGFGQLSYLRRYVNGQDGIGGLGGMVGLAISADGARVFAAGGLSGGLVSFNRSSADGALSVAGIAREGVEGAQGLLGARGIRLSGDGQHLYVASGSGRSLAHYRISGTAAPVFSGIVRSGDAAPLSGGQVLGLDGAADLHVSADGTHVYAVGSLDNAISTFNRSVDADPALSTGALDYRASLFDGLGGVAPGESVSYVIQVDNLGPSAVSQARVVDTFPPEFSAVTWSCSSSGGATCPLGGNGNIDVITQLPVGGQVVFTATGVVGQSATGRLVNTATVSAAGAVDPNELNNSSTDDNTVLSPASDLVVTVDDGSPTAVPGGRVDYLAEVRNLGPSYAVGVRVTDTAPAALYERAWTCEAFPKAGALDMRQSFAGSLDSYTAIVPAGFGRQAYVTGSLGGVGAVALLSRDPLTGTLSLPVLPTGVDAVLVNEQDGVRGIGGAADLLLSNDERFVYVAGRSSDSVAVFSRDAGNGSLSFRAQYQDGELGIDGIGGAHRLRMSPDGRHLYVAGSVESAIAVFNVDASTGLLSPASILRQGVGGVDGLNDIRDLQFSASAGHLLVAAGSNQSLAAFARNATTGALSPFALVQDFELPERLLIDPRALRFAGSTVWVTGGESNTVAGFVFDPLQTPALSLSKVIREGENGVSGLVTPDALQFEADQSRLYVGAAGRLFLFSLQPEEPQLLDSYSAQPPLGGGLSLVSASDRQQLYSASADAGGLGVWARARGSRCPLAGRGPIGEVSVDIEAQGRVEFSVGGRIYPNALGTLDYSLRADTRIAAQELNPLDNVDTDSDLLQPEPDLSVSKTDGLSEVVAGLPLTYTIDLANAGVSDALEARLFDPLPIFPAVNAGLVAGEGSWSCSANLPVQDLLRLTPADSTAIAGIGASRRSADGQRLYAVNPSLGALLVFPLDAQGLPGTPEVIVDGATLGSTTVAGLAGASMVTLSPDDRHIYVTGSSANSLVLLRYDADTGSHSFGQRLQSGVNGVAGLQGAADVHLGVDGRFVFVASASSHAIAVFSRSAESGELAFVERVADGLGTIVPDSNVIRGVRRLALSADGGRLYAAASLSQAVSSFDIGGDGRLQFRGRLRQDQPGMAALAGARALALTPGDGQLYVLGSQAISRLSPQADGSLVAQSVVSAIPELAAARDLKLDATGSRLYLADSAGALFVFARDWADGALDLRYRLPPAAAVTGTPELSLGAIDSAGRMYLSEAAGRLGVLRQQALSRCLDAQTDPDRIDATVDLGVDGSARYEYAVRVHPSARGVLTNVATVSPGEGIDPAPENNEGTDLTQIRAVSDLSVTKTGPVQAVAGLRLNYVIEVGNAGPSDALGMQVVDTLPAALAGATWTCVASAGSSCPAAGSGSLAMTGTVLVGGTLRIEIDAPIASSYLGALVNTVSLVLEPDATDPDLSNNTASASTDVIAIADVSVSKSNSVSTVTAGARTLYAIAVNNLGPSDAPQVRVRDLLPAQLRDAQWTCSLQGGGSCPASGTGSIDQVIAVTAGATALFELDVQVAPEARGSVSNTVTVQVQGAPTDPQSANDSATDTDTISVAHDLAVGLVDPLDPFDSSGSIALPYLVQVDNVGPSDAVGVNLRLGFSAAVQAQLGLSCAPAGSNEIDCDLGTLRAGSSRVLDARLLQLPAPPATLTVVASIGGGDGQDPQQANNSAVEQTTLVAGIDLQVGISNGVSLIQPGDATTYTVLVTNIGSVTATSVQVEVPLAAGLIDASWTCAGQGGASCAPSGSGGISQTVSLARGQSVRYLLSARLDPQTDPAVAALLIQTASALPTAPATDINIGNNTAADEDVIQFIVFRDGFESLTSASPAAGPMFALASACTGLRIDAASPLLAGVTTEARQRVLLSSRDRRGQMLAQVEALQASSGRWLRLRSAQQVGEWLPWKPRFSSLRSAGTGLLLDAGDGAVQRFPAIQGAREWWATAGVDVVAFNACDGEVADGDSR